MYLVIFSSHNYFGSLLDQDTEELQILSDTDPDLPQISVLGLYLELVRIISEWIKYSHFCMLDSTFKAFGIPELSIC